MAQQAPVLKLRMGAFLLHPSTNNVAVYYE
jgi:hypothetical protein